MSIESQYEREENYILECEESGEISHAEAAKQLRDLQRDYRAAAEDAAQGAYEQELERW